MTTQANTSPVVSLDTAAIEGNMSALQSAAHEILHGIKKVNSGKAALMLALVPALRAHVTFTVDKVSYAMQVRDFDSGVRKADGTKDSKLTAALFVAICTELLGITDKDDQAKLRQHFASVLRSAIGADTVALDAGLFPSKCVAFNPAGELVMPLHVAFDLHKDDGTLTPVGVAAHNIAASNLNARAEVMAELTKTDVIPPTPDAIAKAAALLPVTCNGRTMDKANNTPASPFGDLPTATEAMAKLTKYAIAAGVCEPIATRASRAGTPDEQSVATINEVAKMILAVCDPDGDEAAFAPGPVTDAAVAALAKACAAYAKMLKASITH